MITRLSDIKLDIKKMYFDLGSEILLYEAELIINLANHYQVEVLVPDQKNRVFEHLISHAHKVQKLPSQALFSSQSSLDSSDKNKLNANKLVDYKRFRSALAEVKFSVDQIDNWINSGIQFEQILIAAPNIEIYWPVLQTYLDKKNIPYQKNVTAQLGSLKPIVDWMSNLNCLLSEMDSLLFEQSYFNREPKISFDQFKKMYTYIYDSEDIKRDSHLLELYQSPVAVNKKVEFSEFITHAIKYLNSQDSIDQIMNTIKDLFLEFLPNEKLLFADWLRVLSLTLSQKEITVIPSFSNGIQVANIWSCGSLFCKYRIYIGLTEEQLKSKNRVQITKSDAEILLHDLGFQLSLFDDSAAEEELNWLSQNPTAQEIYTYAETNFAGELEMGSLFWIKNNLQKLSEAPHDFDSCLRQSWITNHSQHNPYVVRDFDLSNWPILDSSNLDEISVTQVEKLLNCPFQFFTESKLKLLDLSELDLDINAQDQGQILHYLLEQLISHDKLGQLTNMASSEFENICSKLIEQSNLKIEKNKFWNIQFKKICKLLQQVIKSEHEYLSNYKNIKVLCKEYKIEFIISNTKFKGKVDRIDYVKPNLFLIIDYKTGISKVKNYSEWQNNNDYQLLLYTHALESNNLFRSGVNVNPLTNQTEDLISTQSSTQTNIVASAQYYYLKKSERRGGFLLEDFDGQYYVIGKKKNKIGSTEKSQINKLMVDKISNALDSFKSGQVLAQPEKTDICNKCQWRTICRAPHLI